MLLGLAGLLAGCASGGNPQGEASATQSASGSPGVAAPVPATLQVTSPAFRDGQRIPAQFTCDGSAVSPPLSWHGSAAGARAWAVVVVDPDAPGGNYVHWVLTDIPHARRSVSAGEKPKGAVTARTSAGGPGYAPPCPPSGTHHYRFTVYGLDRPTGLAEGAALDTALAAIRKAAIARGTLVGTYR